jgi:hypothetical protein
MVGKVQGLHVGAHKTGTSLVQRHLERFPETYAGHGLEFVTRDELSRLVAWGTALFERPDLLRDRLAAFQANPSARALFGSYENLLGFPFQPGTAGLYPLARRNLAALAGICGEAPTKVFLSIRRPSEFVESWYLQTVHMGSSQTLDEWLAGVDLTRLSWRPIVTAIADLFGEDGVEVVDFDLVQEGQGAYLGRFLRVLDPDFDDTVDPPTPYNRSVSGQGLRMALGANPHLRDAAERRALRKFLQRHFSNVDHPRPVLLTAERAGVVDAAYDDEIGELRTRNSFARGLATSRRTSRQAS